MMVRVAIACKRRNVPLFLPLVDHSSIAVGQLEIADVPLPAASTAMANRADISIFAATLRPTQLRC
jgi:hypothetical protein